MLFSPSIIVSQPILLWNTSHCIANPCLASLLIVFMSYLFYLLYLLYQATLKWMHTMSTANPSLNYLLGIITYTPELTLVAIWPDVSMKHHNKDFWARHPKQTFLIILQKQMIQEFKVRKAHPKPTHNLKPELYSIVIYLKPQIMDCRLQCWFWFSAP